jgi:hypothetical protein
MFVSGDGPEQNVPQMFLGATRSMKCIQIFYRKNLDVFQKSGVSVQTAQLYRSVTLIKKLLLFTTHFIHHISLFTIFKCISLNALNKYGVFSL